MSSSSLNSSIEFSPEPDPPGVPASSAPLTALLERAVEVIERKNSSKTEATKHSETPASSSADKPSPDRGVSESTATAVDQAKESDLQEIGDSELAPATREEAAISEASSKSNRSVAVKFATSAQSTSSQPAGAAAAPAFLSPDSLKSIPLDGAYARALSAARRAQHIEAPPDYVSPSHHKPALVEDDSHLPIHPCVLARLEERSQLQPKSSDPNSSEHVIVDPKTHTILQPPMVLEGFQSIGELYEKEYEPKWQQLRKREKEKSLSPNKGESSGKSVKLGHDPSKLQALINRLSMPLEKDRLVVVADEDAALGEGPKRVVAEDGTITYRIPKAEMHRRYSVKSSNKPRAPQGFQFPFFDPHAYYLRISVPAGVFNLRKALRLESHYETVTVVDSFGKKSTIRRLKPQFTRKKRNEDLPFAATNGMAERSGFFNKTYAQNSDSAADVGAAVKSSSVTFITTTSSSDSQTVSDDESISFIKEFDDGSSEDDEEGDDLSLSNSYILVAIDRFTPLLSILQRFGPSYFPPGGQLALASTGELLAGASFPSPLGLLSPIDVQQKSTMNKSASEVPEVLNGEEEGVDQKAGGHSPTPTNAKENTGLGEYLGYKCGTGTTITIGMLKGDPRLNELCYVTGVELDEVMERRRLMTGRLVERNLLVSGLISLLQHELRDEWVKTKFRAPFLLAADDILASEVSKRAKTLERIMRREKKRIAAAERWNKQFTTQFSSSMSGTAATGHEEESSSSSQASENDDDSEQLETETERGPSENVQKLVLALRKRAMRDDCQFISSVGRGVYAGSTSNAATRGFTKAAYPKKKKSRSAVAQDSLVMTTDVSNDPLRYTSFFGDAGYYWHGKEPQKTQAELEYEAALKATTAQKALQKELRKHFSNQSAVPESTLLWDNGNDLEKAIDYILFNRQHDKRRGLSIDYEE